MPTSAYEQIRDAILSGAFEGGRVLSENSLAAEFGTSRTPVREALHRLEIERLVERGPRGAVVRTTSPEEILDIYDVRITLEGSAAQRAAQQASALDLVRLRARQEDMRALTSREERPAANQAFHEALWAASHSPTLVDLLDRLGLHLRRYPTSTLDSDDRWHEALAEHDGIIDAIARQDAAAARELAERHMSAAREARLRMYARS
ncbi:GntR family transcriptional regulator [Microbacterium sp. Marseille-Q6965]|uniref:GntR family transcriptional regulator n=1 Tax=Microbacterium sp. Marseille-Q6965 TaxID=2965072 RepID=UPI0021B827D7|nr:GntR family transcriptional regulator [Microbacterium sp. Marseille-Q6965]